MSSFEYVMVIVSIIMGLGITTLLRGTANMLRAESDWAPGPLHSLWVVNLLVMHVGLWSLRWSGARREDWPFSVLLAFLFMPVLYYVLAELLFPRDSGKIDLSEYFLENRKFFFGLMVLISIAATFGPLVFYEGVDPLQRPDLMTSLIGVPVTAFFAFSRHRGLHVAFAVFTLLALFLMFGILEVG